MWPTTRKKEMCTSYMWAILSLSFAQKQKQKIPYLRGISFRCWSLSWWANEEIVVLTPFMAPKSYIQSSWFANIYMLPYGIDLNSRTVSFSNDKVPRFTDMFLIVLKHVWLGWAWDFGVVRWATEMSRSGGDLGFWAGLRCCVNAETETAKSNFKLSVTRQPHPLG